MWLELQVESGIRSGSRIALKPGRVSRIGRTAKADHSFPDDKLMSGIHFSIECTEKGCRLRDLNSSNGTFLNGKKVAEATLQNGDEIVAGRTKFLVRIENEKVEAPAPPPRATAQRPSAAAPPASGKLAPPSAAASTAAPSPLAPPKPTQKPPAPQTPQERLLALLRQDFQPLYALLDAAREPSVLKVIFESKEEYQSLYEGARGAQLTHFAPYLVRIPPKSPLLDTLVHQAWAKSWGVYLTCGRPLKDVRTHFRNFLMVKLPDGKTVNFRYYDPRVLRHYLPTCNVEEIAQFFGPVKHFLVEAEDPGLALQFTRAAKGAEKKELRLAS